METLETLMERRSCRAFENRQLEREVLEKIVEAGRFAPSGMGRQPVHFVIVQDEKARAQITRMNAEIMGGSGDPFYGAPTIVAVLVDANAPTGIEDGSLALGNMMNAAHSLGVGSCWIHRAREEFSSGEGRELLRSWGLPGDGSLVGVGHCALGYPAKDARPAKPRRANVTWVA
ncbi:MAG: diguanylate cyclase [Coriobacteriaceae bacterium]|nr:diguanylate cyclase [Coriobacteriaceae bacterium]